RTPAPPGSRPSTLDCRLPLAWGEGDRPIERYRVYSAAAPRMTATKSSQGETRSLPRPVNFHRLQSVTGTGRLKSASETERAKNRREHGRHRHAICAQQKDQEFLGRIHCGFSGGL